MRNKTLSALLLSEYADILYKAYQDGKTSLEQASRILHRYMHELIQD